MRKAKPKKRVILPDPVFGDVKVSKFVNHLMYDGKKSISYDIFYNALEIVKTELATLKADIDKIKAQIEDFQDIDFGSIGVKDYFENKKPSASAVVLDGIPFEDETLTAKYDFNGKSEGLTRIYWYSSRTADGEYEKVPEGYGKYFKVPANLKGSYIRCEVVPYDDYGFSGKGVMSQPVYVTFDIVSANSRIDEIEAIVNNAVAGNEPGDYPQTAIDNLKSVIETARAAVATAGCQMAVAEAMSVLERALTVFENRVVKDFVTDDEEDTETENSPSVNYPSYGGGAGGSSGGTVFYSNETSTPALQTGEGFMFRDMTDHWAKTDVMNMYKAGIVSGVTADTFEPDRSITRAEFATLVAKALKLESAKAYFGDVKESDWFTGFVGAAAKAGIIAGSDGNFRPNDNITREEMAVIVVKAYEYLGKTAESANLTFSDNEEVSSWAEGYVAKAVGAGLISGMGDNMFAPKANATRAQSASLIARILK